MAEQVATNITWHDGTVTRDERKAVLKQRGCTVWFTGLSASGKSTIAAQSVRFAKFLQVVQLRLGCRKLLFQLNNAGLPIRSQG